MSAPRPAIPEPLVEVEHVDDADVSIDDRPTVELRGRTFAVRQQGVSLLSLMRFATIAKRGVKTEDIEGLTALYALLQSCVAEDQWDAFEAHADAVGAQGEELIGVVRDAVKAAAGRPTQQPSGSPGGQSTTVPSSAAGSSALGSSVPTGSIDVQHDLERRGRPDLALVVQKAREASTTS